MPRDKKVRKIFKTAIKTRCLMWRSVGIFLFSLNALAVVDVNTTCFDVPRTLTDGQYIAVIHSGGNVFMYYTPGSTGTTCSYGIWVSVCSEADILANAEPLGVSQDFQPKSLQLNPAFPNPFNPTTTIEFSLTKPTHTALKIHNIDGQEVAVLIDEFLSAGDHSIDFSATDLASGVYTYTLESGGFSETKKITLIK